MTLTVIDCNHISPHSLLEANYIYGERMGCLLCHLDHSAFQTKAVSMECRAVIIKPLQPAQTTYEKTTLLEQKAVDITLLLTQVNATTHH